MIIRGTPNEIAWITEAIANGSNCDTCPIQRLCRTVHAIQDRNGVECSDCNEIVAKYMIIIEE